MRSNISGFARKLAALPRRMEDAMARAVDEAAVRAAEAARSLAPVDSGELKRGITVRKYGKTEGAAVSAAPHSAMVEYGTSRMPPQPFMLPAAQAVRREFVESARAAAREVLK